MRNTLLAVLALAFAATASADNNGATYRCESSDGKYAECRVLGTGRLMVSRQLSDTACVEGKTWGRRNGLVWVSGGCRADFSMVSEYSDAMDGTKLVCESLNNIRHTCRTNTANGVTLSKRLSANACVRGKSWGTNDEGVWVDKGCRAEFTVHDGGSTSQAAFARTLRCESKKNGRTICSTDTSYGVQLAQQISQNNCELGRDWGYDQRGIWVDNGCRADFRVGGYRAGTNGPMISSSGAPTLRCESVNGQRSFCRANTTYGVTLQQRLSDSSCIRGDSWGYDHDGIWVDKGCRAEFLLDASR
ncbi:MAG TPA: DUF3011 domain-containing protein [Thermoanaerobaculia bacterium]